MGVSGLDIGGSGIKGAPVETGALLEERVRVPTPRTPTPEAIPETSAGLVGRFGQDGPIGVGFLGVVRGGLVHTAANVVKELIGYDPKRRMRRKVGNILYVVNDAADLAEMRWGAGRGVEGIMFDDNARSRLGTALSTEGRLVPDAERGPTPIRNRDTGSRTSDRVRKQEDSGSKKWTKRLNEYLEEMENPFWPGLILVGGEVNRRRARGPSRSSRPGRRCAGRDVERRPNSRSRAGPGSYPIRSLQGTKSV